MTGLRAFTTAVTIGVLSLTMPVLASAQDTHAGHEQQKPTTATTPASEQHQHQAPSELPSFIPPVTDEDRKAAFPDVQGHTVHDIADDSWTRAYTRAEGCFPAGTSRSDKYWSPVGRVDNVYGDRNLVCSCPPIGDYAQAAE